MSNTETRTALYEIVDRRADGACTWATLRPVRTGGDARKIMFCNADDVAYLKDDGARHRMATVLEKNGPAARLLPVTVGLDISIFATSPTGDTSILALPRPAPLRLSRDATELQAIVAAAIKGGQPVVFALSDPKTIIDAAPIDRAKALEMLGMRE